jgi:hypothetical protein
MKLNTDISFFYPFLIVFYWYLAFRKTSLLEKGEMMKKITMFVAGLVFIAMLVSYFSYQSLEPKNVFAKDVVGDEVVIKSAYIDGFMDALMLGQDQIKSLQGNREAIKQEAIMAADIYYNALKKQ